MNTEHSQLTEPSQHAEQAQLAARVKRLENVQDVVLTLDRLSTASRDGRSFFTAAHQEIARIMHARNFYVALYDSHDNTVRFPYFVDERDPPDGIDIRYPLADADDAPTVWVIHNRMPLVLTASSCEEFRWRSSTWKVGTSPEMWVGVPLLAHDGRVLGAAAVQSYDAAETYTDEDIALFGLIGKHIASLLDRLQATLGLERSLAARTAELEHEIATRRHIETLQQSLYTIASLSATDLPIDDIYRTVHEVTARVLYAPNFFVLLYHDDTQEFSFPYFVDTQDELPGAERRFPISAGISSYVLKIRQPLLLDKPRLQALLDSGAIRNVIGRDDFTTWIGAPMIADGRFYGLITAQSYDPAIAHTEQDLQVLSYMATHLAAALSRREAHQHLREAADRVQRRNERLARTLNDLRSTQDELLRHEKLAALASMVTGIANEVHAPLQECLQGMALLAAKMTETEKTRFDCAPLREKLERTTHLVRAFRQVADDQSSGERRVFNLCAYLQEVLLSLAPKLRAAPCDVRLDCPGELRMDTYAGALANVISNLIVNATVYAFEGRSSGVVRVQVEDCGTQVRLSVIDNGVGLDAVELKRFFDPAIGTRRPQSELGLGAHLVYQLVTGILGGSIELDSRPGAGLQVHMRLPKSPA